MEFDGNIDYQLILTATKDISIRISVWKYH